MLLISLAGHPGLAEPSPDPVQCLGDVPLIERHWSELDMDTFALAAWRLPISGERPDVLTQAMLSLRFEPAGRENWEAVLEAIYPGEAGLCFTFQLVELTWTSDAGNHRASLDWSASCLSPGVSIFPGGRMEFHLGIPELPPDGVLSNVQLRLWGSMN